MHFFFYEILPRRGEEPLDRLWILIRQIEIHHHRAKKVGGQLIGHSRRQIEQRSGRQMRFFAAVDRVSQIARAEIKEAAVICAAFSSFSDLFV